MIHEVIAVAIFALAVAYGWFWSFTQRRKAVQSAYDEIRNEVRRERSEGHS